MQNISSVKQYLSISFATQYLELAIHFVAVLILARLLSPGEIGTYSVAAFLMALMHMFRDFGVIQYVIQEHDLTPDKIRSAMGVSILLAWLVSLLVLASSELLGQFYQNSVIEEILVVMAASFAISPFGSLLLGIFRRNMQLKAIFITRIASALCHVTVAITLALQGWGAMSLAWANFAGILMFGLVANLMRPPALPWLPQFHNIRTILSFGGMASMGNTASMAGNNMPDLVIGKVMDMAAVGYFSRANGLIQLFSKLISGALLPLVLPYFAQLRREGKALAAPYLEAVEYLTAFAWPFFAVMMLLSQQIVRVLYGEQWDASVPLVELLCIAGGISSISLFSNQVMIANGQLRHSTRAQLLVMPFRVGAILLAALQGLAAIALALILAESIALLIISRYLRQTIRVSPADLLAAVRNSALIALCSATVPLLVKITWTGDASQPLLPLLIGLIGAAAGWLSGIYLTRHPLLAQISNLLQAAGLTQTGPVADLRRMLWQLKFALKQLAYRAGILNLYHRLRNRDTLTVVMFHRVLPASDPQHAGADPEWTISPDTLSHCLKFFLRHYHIVTPQHVFAAMRGEKKLPARSLLVTFDDGWADTLHYAQPVLARHAVSALIFVSGSALNRHCPFWEEKIFRVLATDPLGLSHLEHAMQQQGLLPAFKASLTMNEHNIRNIIAHLRKLDWAVCESIALQLPDYGNLPNAMLTAQELAELVAASHSIGCHGMTHQAMTRIEDLSQELKNAQASLSTLAGEDSVSALSFPHGAYSDVVITQCREAGYSYLFGSGAFLNLPAQAGRARHVLGRISIPGHAVCDHGGRFQAAMLATWLFLRPLNRSA